MFELVVSTMVLTLTSYRSLPAQTDSSPFITSIGHRVSEQGLAVSQDLIKTGQVCYGDMLYVPGFGLRIVNDTMNKRHRKWVDLWVKTYEDEKQVGVRKNVQVMVIQSPERCCRKPCQMDVPTYNESLMDRLITLHFGSVFNVTMYYKRMLTLTGVKLRSNHPVTN